MYVYMHIHESYSRSLVGIFPFSVGWNISLTVSSSSRLHVTNSVFEDNDAGYDEEAIDDNAEYSGGGVAFLDDRANASFSRCNFTRNAGGVSTSNTNT